MPCTEEEFPEISEGDITAVEKFLMGLFQQLKIGEEFPEDLLQPLTKDPPSVRNNKTTGVAGNLFYNIIVFRL